MTSYAVRTRSPVTSRAAVVYAHKNETIDVITSKNRDLKFLIASPVCSVLLLREVWLWTLLCVRWQYYVDTMTKWLADDTDSPLVSDGNWHAGDDTITMCLRRADTIRWQHAVSSVVRSSTHHHRRCNLTRFWNALFVDVVTSDVANIRFVQLVWGTLHCAWLERSNSLTSVVWFLACSWS